MAVLVLRLAMLVHAPIKEELEAAVVVAVDIRLVLEGQ
jgi:hypothetical protein